VRARGTLRAFAGSRGTATAVTRLAADSADLSLRLAAHAAFLVNTSAYAAC
jgi:hypothetical protein